MVLNPSSFIFKTMSKDKPKSPKSRPGNKSYALGKVRKESSPNSRLSLPVNMLLWQNLSCCEINLARNGRRERQECMDPMCIHVWSEGINRRVAEDNFFFFLMERFCCDKNLSIINCFFFFSLFYLALIWASTHLSHPQLCNVFTFLPTGRMASTWYVPIITEWYPDH